MQRPKPETLAAFRADLTRLVNYHSLENGCDLPDYVIGEFLATAYTGLCAAVEQVTRVVNPAPPIPPLMSGDCL